MMQVQELSGLGRLGEVSVPTRSTIPGDVPAPWVNRVPWMVVTPAVALAAGGALYAGMTGRSKLKWRAGAVGAGALVAGVGIFLISRSNVRY